MNKIRQAFEQNRQELMKPLEGNPATAQPAGGEPMLVHPNRSRFLLFIFFLLFVVLAGRSAWLQIKDTKFLQNKAAAYLNKQMLPAQRGAILDRDGKVLAASYEVRHVWFDNRRYNDALESIRNNKKLKDDAKQEQLQYVKATYTKLGTLLGVSPDAMNRILTGGKDAPIKQNVDMDTVRKIGELSDARMKRLTLDFQGIVLKPGYQRKYPAGAGTAQLIGFAKEEVDDNGIVVSKGVEGMEAAFNSILAGTGGQHQFVRDRQGRIVDETDKTRFPVNGRNITLSIDSRLQHVAYERLLEAAAKHQAKAASAVVLDCNTGEVLAMVNVPSYNPNERGTLRNDLMRNRAITDMHELGSVMKPFTVAAALEKGYVRPTTPIATGDGRFQVGTKVITDTHRSGTISVAKVIEQSSNVGTSKIALGMKPLEMWELFSQVGFGKKPGTGFPAESPGILRPYKAWMPVDQATMSFGHGITVSLLQIASAYQIFARDGDQLPVTFFKRDEIPQSRRVISAKTAREMRKMLEMVTGPEGTGSRARVPGYRVAGKTGTAHKLENGRYGGKYIGTFVGLAPASKPRVIIAVMLDEPKAGHYGGSVAAPVFSTLAGEILRAMSVGPDGE